MFAFAFAVAVTLDDPNYCNLDEIIFKMLHLYQNSSINTSFSFDKFEQSSLVTYIVTNPKGLIIRSAPGHEQDELVLCPCMTLVEVAETHFQLGRDYTTWFRISSPEEFSGWVASGPNQMQRFDLYCKQNKGGWKDRKAAEEKFAVDLKPFVDYRDYSVVYQPFIAIGNEKFFADMKNGNVTFLKNSFPLFA